MIRSLHLLLAISLVGCAHSGKEAKPEAAPPPAWTTQEGRQQARIDMARSLAEMGRMNEAVTLLAEARTEPGSELELDVLQARIYLRMGMAGEAAALLEPWEERRPKHAEFFQVLGLIRFDQQRTEQARAAFERALELDPDTFDNNNNLGFFLLVSDRPEAALPLFRRALELRPGDARAHGNLAFALAALERDDEAFEVFRAVQPPALALANMGLACERRGAPELALTWYRRAVELEPDQALAYEAIERLTSPPPTEATP
jgi:Flp pilus assembly protein TadD